MKTIRTACAIRLLLPALVLALAGAVQAQFTFVTNNGVLTVTGYTGPGGVVIIPSITNGLPVTGIAGSAFNYKSSLTSVTIPSSVTNIGSSPFSPFYYCTNLSVITVDALNSFYSSVDGVLFNKGTNKLIQCPGGKVGIYTIPNSVTNIGNYAFGYCARLINVTIGDSVANIGSYAFRDSASLTNVTIPNSVTNIGSYAFSYCASLTSITIPNSVTSIGGNTFRNCTSLTSVSLGTNISTIGIYAFYYCINLTSVSIPNSVTSIGNNAFYYCTSLTSISLGNNVTNIGIYAFYYCTSLTSVSIPNSVTSIGNNAFYYCTSLSAIIVDSLNPAYSSTDGVLFDKSETMLIQYPGGKEGNYTIPNSVTSIGDGAFFSCTSLASVMIGYGITNIGDSAFCYCTNLTGVYFRGNTPNVGYNPFYGDNKATGHYLPGTTGWDSFNALPITLWLPQLQTGDVNFGVRTNRFGFNIFWASGMVVVVEACTNLTNPVWSLLRTNTLVGDTLYFSDPQWTNHPTRFYRLRWP